uniref:Uncharacterized protein n=1 Tax=Rhodosorus marinus TaxID=101924 RepID=A0A7S2ZQJ0_9RHOD|mmetsp:Transcript_28462/g.111548  ORF Transcript_28462/g.111548 Transcript_28462/m.111548 type:complete len:252 (+) Transcript_28462:260-1015(+)
MSLVPFVLILTFFSSPFLFSAFFVAILRVDRPLESSDDLPEDRQEPVEGAEPGESSETVEEAVRGVDLERWKTFQEALELVVNAASELQTIVSGFSGLEAKAAEASIQRKKEEYGIHVPKRKRGSSSSPSVGGLSSLRTEESLRSVAISSAAASTSDVEIEDRISRRRRRVQESVAQDPVEHAERHSDKSYAERERETVEELPSQMLAKAFPPNAESKKWRTQALSLVEKSLPLEVLLDPSRHLSKLSYRI